MDFSFFLVTATHFGDELADARLCIKFSGTVVDTITLMSESEQLLNLNHYLAD